MGGGGGGGGNCVACPNMRRGGGGRPNNVRTHVCMYVHQICTRRGNTVQVGTSGIE